MKRKKLYLFIIIILVILAAIIYKSFEHKAMNEYTNQPLPFYAQDKTTNKIIYAENPKKIVQNMIGGEEYFKGDLELNYLNANKVEIKMRNYGTGDDSLDAVEYYAVSEKRQQGWEITQYKTHWKCSRGYSWPNFWTTSGCI